MTTTVVHLKRKGGVVVQDCDVYIGRALNQGGWHLSTSRWANPYKIGRDGTRDDVLAKYRQYILTRPDLLAALPELKGKILGCWCKPELCHGDVLIELINELEQTGDQLNH